MRASSRFLRHTSLASLAALLAASALTAQATVPMPRSFQKAIAKGERTLSGRPGARYWQNNARYQITLDVRPPEARVNGQERIVYRNHSPDSLRSVVFKLFLNEHKAGAARNGTANPASFMEGVVIDKFAINGQSVAWRTTPRTGTWADIRLPSPLSPNDSVTFDIDWHFTLSTEPGREGVIDPGTFYLAYFYPRVAVYDDYNGWDRMDFTGSQEFYSDFNDYDVTIRSPKNFVVWGTGMLSEPSQVLAPTTLARYTASLTSDTVLHVATASDMAARGVTRQDSLLSWRFESTNVPDVAFGISDHYAWDAGSVIVDPVTKRRVSVQAAFADSAADFHHMVTFAGEALTWLSRHWPGVAYPYPKTTVFQGYADMEYPMMVNDNTVADTGFARFVVAHELAHTWFPFYMGINETRYPFMDEGWATTLEYLYNQSTVGPEQAATLYKQFRVARWIGNPSAVSDIPIIIPGDALRAGGGDNAYGKASLGYLALKELLGDQLFGTALHAFMDRWHGKHPAPWDFFHTINDVTGRNLNWFWQRWYFDPSYIDLAIVGTEARNGRTQAVIRNIGGMPAPFDLTVTWADGTTTTTHHTPAVWQTDPALAHITLPAGKTVTSLSIDGGIWMDADLSNNRWTRGK